MTVGEATRLYQAALEEHRRDPDEFMTVELEKAKSVLEVVWLEMVVTKCCNSLKEPLHNV